MLLFRTKSNGVYWEAPAQAAQAHPLAWAEGAQATHAQLAG